MRKTRTSILALVASLIIYACGSTEQKETSTEQVTADTLSTATTTEISGDYCFLKAENKDSTTVRIRVLSSDDIRGEMIWNPYEKDGAVGTLTGKMNANNEMELMYSYTIEGNQQSEAKVMKIENNQLLIKAGELIDPKNNGNLILKDASKASYAEVLKATNCN